MLPDIWPWSGMMIAIRVLRLGQRHSKARATTQRLQLVPAAVGPLLWLLWWCDCIPWWWVPAGVVVWGSIGRGSSPGPSGGEARDPARRAGRAAGAGPPAPPEP